MRNSCFNATTFALFQFIINNQALPCLLALLTNNHKKSIKKEACWTISNITAGNKEQIQVRFCLWSVQPIMQLMSARYSSCPVNINLLFTIQIPLNTKLRLGIIQAVIDANIIPPLVALLASAEFDIKKEAAWAVSNATSGGTAEQIKYCTHSFCSVSRLNNNIAEALTMW